MAVFSSSPRALGTLKRPPPPRWFFSSAGSHTELRRREMAVGNTFGATALSSYGGFWIAYAILQTPSMNILGPGGPYATAAAAPGGDPKVANSAIGFFLTGWFIFTTIL